MTSVVAHAGRREPLPDRLAEQASWSTNSMLAEIADTFGRAGLGSVVDGALDGLRRFLIEQVGPEAAYNTLQRAADAVIEARGQPPP